MKRILLAVSYDGTNYHGWQEAEGVPTIAGELNGALSRLEGKPVKVSGTSRTDAGVHARMNLAVFDTALSIPGDRFSYVLNTMLPDDIRVRSSKEVEDGFDPRFRKTEKTYIYSIYEDSFPDPVKRLYAFYSKFHLDTAAMQEAADYLVGEHDFKSFCAAHAQVLTTVRQINGISVQCCGNDIKIIVKGYGFLYNMVRIIAGTLMEAGRGRYEPSHVKEILDGRDRGMAGPTAPPQGLLLYEIRLME